jgi:hypothetical protein
MKRRMRAFFVFFSLAALADAQSEMRNTVTVSGGFAHNVGNSCCGESAPSLAMTYDYRLFPHVDLEAGVDTTLSLGTQAVGANYNVKADDRLLWVPFGLKGVLPLRSGRVEVTAGAGGLYEKYLVSSNSGFFTSRSGWGGYGSTGVAVALDGGRHFWVGVSPQLFFANTGSGYTHDRWFVLNVGLGFRF